MKKKVFLDEQILDKKKEEEIECSHPRCTVLTKKYQLDNIKPIERIEVA